MSAAYAHIAMVTKASNGDLMEREKLDIRVMSAISRYFKYCELGSISPDYSYLAFWAKLTFQGNENIWSDKMHYEKTGEFIHLGIDKIKEMPESDRKDKCMAWLFGYAAHMTTDTVIHPIVEKLVGEYATHKYKHRICEMCQDVYIFNKYDLGKITRCEYFDAGIKTCGSTFNLDSDIYELWNSILNSNYNELYEINTPNIHQWHFGFKNCIDMFADNGGIPVISRHTSSGDWFEVTSEKTFKALAFSYPDKLKKDDEDKYITKLFTPEGDMTYLKIFEKALKHVLEIWKFISDGIYSSSVEYKTKIKNWDMGTGRNQQTKNFEFWNGEF